MQPTGPPSSTKTTMTTDWAGIWVREKRPIPDGLEADFRPDPYRDPFMTPVLEKIDAATRDDLVRLMGGWPVDV